MYITLCFYQADYTSLYIQISFEHMQLNFLDNKGRLLLHTLHNSTSLGNLVFTSSIYLKDEAKVTH